MCVTLTNFKTNENDKKWCKPAFPGQHFFQSEYGPDGYSELIKGQFWLMAKSYW